MKLEVLISGDLRPGCDTIEVAMGLQKAGVDVTLDPREVVGGLPLSFLPLLARDPLGKQFDVRLGIDCTPALGKTMVAWSARDMRPETQDLDLMILTHPDTSDTTQPPVQVLPFGFDPERFSLRDPGLASGRRFRVLVDPSDEHVGALIQDLGGRGISLDPIRERDYVVADAMLLTVEHSVQDARRAIEFSATGGVVLSPPTGPFPDVLPVSIDHERPDYASQLSQQILMMASSGPQLYRAGQSASARVHSEFAWPIIIQKLLRHITRVL